MVSIKDAMELAFCSEETPGGAIAGVDRFHNDPVVKWADIHAETSTWAQEVLVGTEE